MSGLGREDDDDDEEEEEEVEEEEEEEEEERGFSHAWCVFRRKALHASVCRNQAHTLSCSGGVLRLWCAMLGGDRVCRSSVRVGCQVCSTNSGHVDVWLSSSLVLDNGKHGVTIGIFLISYVMVCCGI